MKTKKLIEAITRNLTDDLRRKPWKGSYNPLAGHCYVASEAFYHISGGRKSGITPMVTRCDGLTHWYLRINGAEYIDITEGQFLHHVDHSKGVGCGFLTSQPSQRAQVLINRVLGK